LPPDEVALPVAAPPLPVPPVASPPSSGPGAPESLEHATVAIAAPMTAAHAMASLFIMYISASLAGTSPVKPQT
jgi:hypothetical protein